MGDKHNQYCRVINSRLRHTYFRPPGALWCSPVYRLTQQRKLRSTQTYGALSGPGPDKTVTLQTIDIQIDAIAAITQHFDPITTSSTEYKDISRQRFLGKPYYN
jgi:hypothetical protein